jgi:hypothetical protein
MALSLVRDPQSRPLGDRMRRVAGRCMRVRRLWRLSVSSNVTISPDGRNVYATYGGLVTFERKTAR